MSLEEHLAANTAAITRNSELLEKLVARAEAAAAGGAAASTTAAADTKGKGKGKGAGAKADAESGSSEGGDAGNSAPSLTHAEVKQIVGNWLAEFKEDKSDPETDARRAAVKAALFKLTEKEGAQVTDVAPADLPRVIAWLDKKKEADTGHGKGRLTAKPEAEKPEADGGDDDI